MTKEEQLIAEYLKKNTPKKYDDEYEILDPFARGYVKLTDGKECSYCGTILNAKNTFVKDISKYKITEDIVLCRNCATHSSNDKTLLNKVGYETFLVIKDLKNELSKYKKIRSKFAAEKRQNIYSIKNSKEQWVRIEYVKYTKEDGLKLIEGMLERYNKETNDNVKFKEDEIKRIIETSKFVLKKYTLDYTKLSRLTRDKEIEDFKDDYQNY